MIKLDYRFGYLIGSYISEGSISNNIISFPVNCREYYEPILEFCKDFNIFVKIYKRDYEENIDRQYINIYNFKLSVIIKKLCGNISRHRYISDNIVFSNRKFLLGLLNSYLYNEGYICKKGVYRVFSFSKKLLIDIQWILNYFDIYSFIKVIKIEKKEEKQKYIELKIENIKPFYNLKIQGKQIYVLLKLINKKNDYSIIHEYYINKHETIIPDEVDNNLIYKQRKEGEFKDILFDRIVKIEEVKNTSKYAYDLTVKDTRNFNIYNG